MVDYFKRPWENRASYAAHSPLTFADKVTTPLLIQHGEVDPRVPIAGAWKFYRALKAMGKTVEFEIYPRGGHVLREPMQQREQMRRNLEWFTRWMPLKPVEAELKPKMLFEDALRHLHVDAEVRLIHQLRDRDVAGDARRADTPGASSASSSATRKSTISWIAVVVATVRSGSVAMLM